MAKMNLNATDRVMVERLFPQENDIITMTMVRDLRGRTSLSNEDIQEIELRGFEGKTIWNAEKSEKLIKEYEFSEAEMTFLKERVEELNKTKKVPEALLDLCKKVREGGKDGGEK